MNMVVSKKLIRKLVELICGRFCDECPIQEECKRCLKFDPTDNRTTMDEIINLIKEIDKGC